MFLPLHDQNNEPVRVTPVISYGLIAVAALIYCYQLLIGIGHPALEHQFVMSHGLVPAPLIKGSTEYSVVIPVSKKNKKKPSFKKPAEKSDPYGFDEFMPQYQKVENTWFWVLMMPVTYMFLHAGWMHLIGNLWFFWIFSDNVEERLGPVVFLAFYRIAGVAGGLLHLFLHMDSTIPLVGASGAVSGVMGAYVLMFPGNRITSYFCPIWFFIRRIDVSAWMVLGFYILFNFLAMLQSDTASGVAFDCHVGGFLVGVVFGFLFRQKPS